MKFVVSASTATTDGIDLAAQYIVNHATAQVMSTSYGSCEADMGSAERAFYNSLWQQAASEGISSFVSSGDSGAAGCYSGAATSASGTGVNGLCSSPYSTCVGGTEFNEGSNSAAYWSSTNGAGDGSALELHSGRGMERERIKGRFGTVGFGRRREPLLYPAGLAKGSERYWRSQWDEGGSGRGNVSIRPRRLHDR